MSYRRTEKRRLRAKRRDEYRAAYAMIPTAPPVSHVSELVGQITLNPGAQHELLHDLLPLDAIDRNIPQSVLWYKSGIGSGKSFAGAAWSCSRALIDPEARGLITANDYGQLETSTLVALAEFCDKYRVPLSPLGASPDETAKRIASNRACKIGNAYALVLSADKFTARTKDSQEAGRGLQVRWCWADEYAYAKGSALDTILGRIGRGNGSIPGTILITSSINKNDPYNWAWQRFDDPDRTPEAVATYRSITGTTLENIHLPPDFVTRLRAGYTDELFQVEVMSEYAAIVAGRIFKYFSRDRHCIPTAVNPDHPIHVSFDFNHSPAVALAAQFIEGELWIIREWYLTDSNTFESSAAVAEWVAATGTRFPIEVHGDASGAQHTANSRSSNWDIVFESFRRVRLKPHRCFKAANPPVQGTINSCNAALMSNLIAIHPDCRELVKDFEALKFDRAGGIDKSDPTRSHLADAFRYIVQDLLPFESKAIALPRSSQSMPVGVF